MASFHSINHHTKDDYVEESVDDVKIKREYDSDSDSDSTDEEAARSGIKREYHSDIDEAPAKKQAIRYNGMNNKRIKLEQNHDEIPLALRGNHSGMAPMQKKTKKAKREERRVKRAAANEARANELIKRAKKKDLDFGPLTFNTCPQMNKSRKNLEERRLAMKDTRLIRERFQHQFDLVRRPYELEPAHAMQQAWLQQLQMASLADKALATAISMLEANLEFDAIAPVGMPDSLTWSLWSEQYLSFLEAPICVELHFRELSSSGVNVPNLQPYSADLLFMPLYGVQDRVINIPYMMLPSADASVSLNWVYLRALKFDPVAQSPLGWMKDPNKLIENVGGPIEYFQIGLRFLGHGRMQLTVPIDMVYRTTASISKHGNNWPRHAEFFAEPVVRLNPS